MENKTRYEMNAIYSEVILPNSILLILGTVIGIVGNLLILFLYTFGLKDTVGQRFFIPVLALVDTLGCLVSVIFYLMDNYFLFDFPSAILCQILSFFMCFTSGCSGHLLLVIALQRYFLICRPLGRQMTSYIRKVTVLVLFVGTFVYSLPLFLTSGIRLSNKVFLHQTVAAGNCVLSVKVGPEAMVYFVILFLITIINIVLIAGFYIPVTKTIYQHIKMKNRRRSTIYNVKMSIAAPSTVSTLSESTTSAGSAKSTNIPEMAPYAKTQINIMFLAIITVYVFSYLPSFAILLTTYIKHDFDYLQLSPMGINAWIFSARLIFLNHIVNPFIYGYFDVKLRFELRRIFCRK